MSLVAFLDRNRHSLLPESSLAWYSVTDFYFRTALALLPLATGRTALFRAECLIFATSPKIILADLALTNAAHLCANDKREEDWWVKFYLVVLNEEMAGERAGLVKIRQVRELFFNIRRR
jgi:hypothetical protein